MLALLLAAAAFAAPVKRNVVLFLGDSLSAGYGVEPDQAYPALIGQDWEKRGVPIKVRNASVSGATSEDLLSNADWALTPDVKLVFLEIGANDGLRGLPVAKTKRNIARIIEACRKKGAEVALAGMKIPPNYGEAYTKSFEAVYPELARKYHLKLMPFLLKDVAGHPDLNQADGIHPNAEGHRIIAENVEAFLKQAKLAP